MSCYPWKRTSQNAHLVIAAGGMYYRTACNVVLPKNKSVDANPEDERCLSCSQVSFSLERPDIYPKAERG